MTHWTARYEDGYMTEEGATVTLTDRVYDDQPWASPETALQYWTSTGLKGRGVRRYLNGLQQTVDVRRTKEFASLGVVTIWRRVSFTSAGPAMEAARCAKAESPTKLT